MLKIDVAGYTDVGNVRQQNEDQFLIANLTKSLQVLRSSMDVREQAVASDSHGHLLIVADGMGGRSAGERASSVVVCSLADSMLNMLRWHFRASARREPEVMADLKEAVVRCQRQIDDEIRQEPDTKGMGTTLTLAYLLWPRMFVVHVGDSRLYRLRNGDLKQLTRDHTWAQLMVESDHMSEEEARTSKYSHVLWNVVGGENDDIQPDIFREDIELGDTLLLCTDGLTKHVPDKLVRSLLKKSGNANEAAQLLIETAKRAGGTDNVTVIVARFPMTAEEASPEGLCEDAFDGRKTSIDLTATLEDLVQRGK
jgi:protein phosphatase